MNIPKEQIRQKGLRVTPARVTVLKVLEDSEKPLDIFTIYNEVVKRRVDADQATIYRIIENFVENDLAKRLQLQEKKFYYEAKRAEHHHAVCRNCSEVIDISRCAVKRTEKKIEERFGFKVESHSLEFFGICSNCQ